MNIENKKEKDLSNRGYFFQKMITQNIILRNPKFNFKNILDYENKLIFIEKFEGVDSLNNYIPCLFLINNDSQNFLICFHGNSEDILSAEKNCLILKTNLNMNVVIVEYPKYSIYTSDTQEPKQIYQDAEKVYDWLNKKLNVPENNIFIYGRSLGTSPAIYLSSIRSVRALIVVSPFTSIKDIGYDKYCSWFVEDIFPSIDYIQNIKCPILLIHGKKDTLIKYQHSEKLRDIAKTKNPNVYLQIRDEMTHNEFDFSKDIIEQIVNFMIENKIDIKKKSVNIYKEEIKKKIKIPKSVYNIIESIIFNITKFEVFKEIPHKNNLNIIKLIDERIAIISTDKISIYDSQRYNLDYDINIFENIEQKNDEISSVFQMKNESLICSTRKGLIFKLQLDLDDFENIGNNKIENEEIFKIDAFDSDFLCCLTNKHIYILNDNLEIISSFDNLKEFGNFVKIGVNKYAFLSKDCLYLCLWENKKITGIPKIEGFHLDKIKDIMTTSEKNVIIGGKGGFYFCDPEKGNIEFKTIPKIQYNQEDIIINIHKIHDKLFLASTFNGIVLQIKIENNFEFNILQNKFRAKIIKSLLFQNLKCICAVDEDSFYVIKLKKQEDSCIIL